MAKVNMAYKIQTLDGKDIQREKGSSLKLKDICIEALLNPEPGPEGRPEQIDGKEKFQRYILAMMIHNAKDSVELSAEEISKLKGLIGKTYGPLVVGQAWEMLEGKQDK